MLYIFNMNDILLSIITEYDDFKHITKVNSIDSLSFSTDDIEYIERYNKVGFFNSDDEFQLFFIDDTDIEYTEGKTKVSAECVSDLSVLRNNIIEDKRVVNGIINVALEKALENTEYKVGNIEQFESSDINFYFISSLEALNDIINTYSCEFSVRIEIDLENGVIKNKYIDIKHRLGEDTGLRFTYDVNLEFIQKSNVTEGHFNVLYGRGKALETENSGYSRKLDFAIVNNDKKYVEDIESIAKYGRLEGIYENSDIEEPELLLKQTLEKLQETKYPKYSYAVSIDDLSDIDGFEHYKVVKGDTIAVLDEENDLVIEARIIEIEDDKKTKLLTLGNFIEGLSGNIDGEDIGSIKDKIDIIDQSPIDDSKYPDILPDIPIIKAEGLFSTVSLEWTYENKLYYTYEVFASRLRDFAPDSTNRIYEGKASAFLHEVKPSETWYYRARAKNTHGKVTGYSAQVEASTQKISDAAEWFEEAAIGEAVIGKLKADRAWIGKFSGTYIDAKNLSVTDGNGKKTLDIDSFGNVNLDVTTLKIKSDNVTTTQDLNDFKFEVTSSGGANLIKNSGFKTGNLLNWFEIEHSAGGEGKQRSIWTNREYVPSGKHVLVLQGSNIVGEYGVQQNVPVKSNTDYTLTLLASQHRCSSCGVVIRHSNSQWLVHEAWSLPWANADQTGEGYERKHITFNSGDNTTIGVEVCIFNSDDNGYFWATDIMLSEGKSQQLWQQHAEEVYTGITSIDEDGVYVKHSDGSRSELSSKALDFYGKNNKKTLTVTNGGIEFTDASNDEGVGFMKSSTKSNNGYMNGFTCACSNVGDYISFGAYDGDIGSSTWSATSLMEIIPWGNNYMYNGWQGLVFNAKAMCQNGMYFKSNDDNYPHKIQGFDGGRLGIIGNNSVFVAFLEGDNIKVKLELKEADNKMYNYVNWNFGNYTMTNMVTSYELPSVINKTYTETTTIESEQREVRFVFEDMKINRGKAIINIPKRYVNLMTSYSIVSLVKKGKGDIWVSREDDERFTIEAEEDINFNCEIRIILQELTATKSSRQQQVEKLIETESKLPITIFE